MHAYGRQTDFEVRREYGAVQIPTAIDMKFRRLLLDEAAECGVRDVHTMIAAVLQNGPSPGGVEEAMRHFGGDLDAVLVKTAPLIEALEFRHPSFSKWLNVTGFGNDKDMIAAFALWAERKD